MKMRAILILLGMALVALAQQECERIPLLTQMEFIQQGMQAAKFFHKELKPQIMGCLDIEDLTSEKFRMVMKDCTGKLFRSQSIMMHFKSGPFLDLAGIRKVKGMLDDCLVTNLGMAFNSTYVDPRRFQEIVSGQTFPEDIESAGENKPYLQCLLNAKGATARMHLRELQKCGLQMTEMMCAKKNASVGLLTAGHALSLTVDDESKCKNIKFDKEFNRIQITCINEAKEKLGPLSPDDPISMEKNVLRKFKLVFARFFKAMYYDIKECFPDDVLNSFFMEDRKTLNIEGIVQFLTRGNEWNDIPEERDMLREGVRECMKDFNEDVSMDGEETEEKKMKRWMKAKLPADTCVYMKYAKICGINNDYAKTLVASMNKELMSALMGAFMETSGDLGEMIMTIAKSKMESLMME